MVKASKNTLRFLKSIGVDTPMDQYTPMYGTGDEEFDAFARVQGELESGDKTFESILKTKTMSPDDWRASLTEETFGQGGYTQSQWEKVKADIEKNKGNEQVGDDPESPEDILKEPDDPIDTGMPQEEIDQLKQGILLAYQAGDINQATYNAWINAVNNGIYGPDYPGWPKYIEDPPVVQGGPGTGAGAGGGGKGKMGGGLIDIFKDITFGGGKLGLGFDKAKIHKDDDLIAWMVDQQNRGLKTFTTEEWQQAIGYTPQGMDQPGSLAGTEAGAELLKQQILDANKTEIQKAAEIQRSESDALNQLTNVQLIDLMRNPENVPDWWSKRFPSQSWPPTKLNANHEMTVDWESIRQMSSAFDPNYGLQQEEAMLKMEMKQKELEAQNPLMTSSSQFMQIPGMDVGIPVIRNPDGTISQINVPTLDKQIDRAIITGDSSRARQLINIRDMPSATEKLNLALQIAQSPADAFQVSRLASGEGMERFGQAAPYLQSAIQDVFGPTSDPFRNLGSAPGGGYGIYPGMLPAGIDMQQLGASQQTQIASGIHEGPATSAFQPTISPEATALAQAQRPFPTQMSIGPDGTATPFNFEGYTEPGAVGSMYQGSMAGQPLDYGQQGMGGATASNDIRNILTQGDERFGGGGFAVDPEMEAWKRAQGGAPDSLGNMLAGKGYFGASQQQANTFGPNRAAPTQATYNAPPVSQSMYTAQNTGFKAGDTVGGLPVRVGNPLLEGTPVDRPSSLFSTLGLRVPSMQATQNWLPEERQLAESYVKGLGIDPNRLWDEVQIGTPGGGMKPGIRWKESFLD